MEGQVIVCRGCRCLDSGSTRIGATLTQHEQNLGDTHPDTLHSRNNLANAYQKPEAVQHGSAATSSTEAAPQKPSTAD